MRLAARCRYPPVVNRHFAAERRAQRGAHNSDATSCATPARSHSAHAALPAIARYTARHTKAREPCEPLASASSAAITGTGLCSTISAATLRPPRFAGRRAGIRARRSDRRWPCRRLSWIPRHVATADTSVIEVFERAQPSGARAARPPTFTVPARGSDDAGRAAPAGSTGFSAVSTTSSASTRGASSRARWVLSNRNATGDFAREIRGQFRAPQRRAARPHDPASPALAFAVRGRSAARADTGNRPSTVAESRAEEPLFVLVGNSCDAASVNP